MITPRKGLFVVVIMLLLCALLNARWTGWFTRPVNRTVETLSYPAGLVASSFRSDPAVDYSQQTDKPLADSLAAERAWNDQLWQENERLREQLEAFEAIAEIRDIKAIQLVEARVSRFNGDAVNPTMKIMRGSLHRIKRDDAVAFKSNLIGFVTDDIGPVNATVTLITRPGFEIEVNIMPPQGVRAGQGWPVTDRAKSDGKGGFVCELDDQITQYLRKGDLVRVSDTIRGSANGFVLGVIAEIKDHDKRPLQLDRVIIKPRTPIGPQRMVTVLTDRTD